MKRPTLRVLVISCALGLAALESVGILLHLLCYETCLNSGHFRIEVNSTTLRRIDRPRKPTWEGKLLTYSPSTPTRVGELGNFEDGKVLLANPLTTRSTTLPTISSTSKTAISVVPHRRSESVNAHGQLFGGVVPRMINSFIIRMGRPFHPGKKPHHTHSSIKSGMKFNGGSGGEKSANFPIKERPMEEQKEPTWKEQDRQIWQSALSGHEGSLLENTIPVRNQSPTLRSKPMSDFKPEKNFTEDYHLKRRNATKGDRIKTNPLQQPTVPKDLIEGDKSEFWVKILALMANLVLALGGYTKRPILYLPWMVIYGMEIVGGWAVGLTFLLFPEFHLAALCCLGRTIFLTWMWISLVRRHQKEVAEMVNRPRLQTIFSIMTAHPFSPRPDLELSVRPPPPSFD